MALQQMDRQLLLGLMAIQQGLITDEHFLSAFQQTASATDRIWIEISIDKGEVPTAAAAALQQHLQEEIERHAGDVSAYLKTWPISEDLHKKLSRLKLAEVDALLSRLIPNRPAAGNETATGADDHYGTIVSKVIEQPAAPSDPYSTGTFSESACGAVVSQKPDRDPVSMPGTAALTGVATDANSLSASVSGTSQANTSFDPSSLPSGSFPPSQPATEAAETPTHVPTASPSFSSEQPTLIPDPDYSTLRSDLAGTGPSAAESTLLDRSLGQSQSGFRFRVLREHAKGGLGKVSVAEDLELRREVAFKEIQQRFADDIDARSRFLLEAEITGSLEHPGIVPVYGLGTHADGRPYYAMRFIRGTSLQEAIDTYHEPSEVLADPGAKQVEFRKLLRRFVDVCNAMDYAHSRGIIHRDMKPGNVMLGDYGETLVVDWGIAKSVKVRGSLFRSALERLPQLTLSEGSQTMMGVAIGTPQFMSPEQAEGKLNELGPASDIYSLGATLYCLLTGGPAFNSKKLLEILQHVKSGTFPPPIEINPRTPKPLNAICLKAMNLVPALRDETAKDLASDIESWLADEPVVAYTEDRWEQLSRWVRRHQARAQAAVVAVVVIAVVSVIAAILIDQSRRAEADALRRMEIANNLEIAARKKETAAKQEALRRSKQTREAVDTLLSGVSDALDAFPGMHDARRRLLERAAQDYARLAQENNKEPELQAEAARSLVRLADVQATLNSIDNARTALVQAEEIFKQQLTASRNDPQFVLELATTNTKRGLLEMKAGKTNVAVTYFQTAIASLEELVKNHPDQIDYLDGLGTALISLGKAEQQASKRQDAAKHLQQAMALFQDLRKKFPASSRVLTATANSEKAYGIYLIEGGRAAEAVQIFNQAIEAHDVLVDEFPKEPDYYVQRAAARLNLAEALRGLGRWAVVVRNDESCVSDLQQVVRARPDVPLYREDLAIARTNLGQSLRRLGSNTESVPILQKALESFEEMSASYPLPRYIEGLANTRISLAQVFSDLGQQDAALPLANLAIEDYRRLLDEVDPESLIYQESIGLVYCNRGRILARRGDLPGGVQSYETGLASLKAAADKEPQTARFSDRLASAWGQFGQVQFAAGQTEAARTAFTTAITLRRDMVTRFKTSTQYQDSLAWLLATCPIEELRDGKRALELATGTTLSIPDSPQHWLTQGAAHVLLGEFAAAATALEQSQKLRGQEEGITLCLKAIAAAKLNQVNAAKASLTAAKAWQKTQKPADEEVSFWTKQAEEGVGTPAAAK